MKQTTRKKILVGSILVASAVYGGYVNKIEQKFAYHSGRTLSVFNVKGIVIDVDPFRDEVRIDTGIGGQFLVTDILQTVALMPKQGDSLLLKTSGTTVDSVSVVPN